MKLYGISLRPSSGFGTSLKGDTLFGHFCWQAAYDPKLLNGGLDKWIACYGEKPFAVFSSSVPYLPGKAAPFAVKKPDLPRQFLFRVDAAKQSKEEQIRTRKENNKKKWLLLDKSLSINLSDPIYRTDSELAQMTAQGNAPKTWAFSLEQPHNTINRMTSTTGEGAFAPFSETVHFYQEGIELVTFVLVDEEATDIGRVCQGLERIGQFGFGKNASTGLGRFRLGSLCEEMKLAPRKGHNAVYALAPVVPKKGVYRNCYFQPFVRFGKHGDRLVHSNHPFKNPVVMADEGAVFVPEDERGFEKPYMGSPVWNTSKALKHAVVQGYAPYLPFQLEALT